MEPVVNFILKDGILSISDSQLKLLKSDFFERMFSTELVISRRIELDYSREAVQETFNYQSPSSVKKEDDKLLAEMIQVADYFGIQEAGAYFCQQFFDKKTIDHWTPETLAIGIRHSAEILVQLSPRKFADLIFKGFPYDLIRYSKFDTHFMSSVANCICNDRRCTAELFARYFSPATMTTDRFKLYDYVVRGFLDPLSAIKILVVNTDQEMQVKTGINPVTVEVRYLHAIFNRRTYGYGWHRVYHYRDMPDTQFYEICHLDKSLIKRLSLEEYKASKPTDFTDDHGLQLHVYAVI